MPAFAKFGPLTAGPAEPQGALVADATARVKGAAAGAESLLGRDHLPLYMVEAAEKLRQRTDDPF